MLLSDAIAMGRTLVTAIPSITLTDDGLNGCALGMGYKAAGGKIQCHPVEVSIGLEAPMQLWPWLEQFREIPCQCGIVCCLNAAQVIAHLFDYHVMGSTAGLNENEAVAAPWTLDELIDWIASNEPAEPDKEALAAQIEQTSQAIANAVEAEELQLRKQGAES